MTLTVGADGKKHVSGEMPKDWEMGAKACGMSDAEYAISMLEIEEEAKNGKSKVIQLGDGVIYK